jgi:SAM-dependent methyltransferase
VKVADAPNIFDRTLLRRRRMRALRGEPADFLLRHVAEELVERLFAVKRSFGLAVDIGTPGPVLRKTIRLQGLAQTVIGVDPLADRLPEREILLVAADEEALPLADGSLDLIVSALALQLVNDLPGVLAQVRRALKPDGLFLGALLGGDTLTELRQSFATAEAEIDGGASPHVATSAGFSSVRGWHCRSPISTASPSATRPRST